MCGIVAIAGAPADRLDAAVAALAHRGPDGRGTWRGDGIALGHTRLAVIDPVGGAQPIANEDGSIVAVVNGELYGHAELRRDLVARGHVLRTRCDAEVLVHLYEEHGDDVLDELRGELAFVLWDARRRRLLAGRDRFGIKPLVWARLRDGIALASEAKALFALGVPARWDTEMFWHAAHVQYPWPDRTLFAGVHQLEPGCTLSWTRGAPRIARYWEPHFAERPDAVAVGMRTDTCADAAAAPAASSDAVAAQARADADAGAARSAAVAAQTRADVDAAAVRAVLDDAVSIRTRADARVCVQLSGGLDSTTVAALARAGGVQHAFTVAFADGGAYDEHALAADTARQLGLAHEIVTVDRAALAAHWPAAVAHGESLAINGHLVGKWLLSRAMRDTGFKVALTGEGADELFAGYPHLRSDAGAMIIGHTASRGVMLPTGKTLATDGVRARLGYVPTWLAAKASLGFRVRQLLAPDLGRGLPDPYGALIDRLGVDRLRRLSPLHASTATWMQTALASYILRTLGDGMEMAHGIEGRVPFLDHRLAELAFAMSPADLVGAGPLDKPVLRRAVAAAVPPAIAARPKHPFLAPPLSSAAPELVQDLLRSHAQRSPLVDRARLLAILDALPGLPAAERQAWDPALMLVLSAAIVEARYCR